MMRKSTIGCSIFVLLISSPVALPAYDRETHRAIAERSVDPSVSSLDRFLRDDLGLEAGIRERFPGRSEPGLRTVQQLVGAGASFEDVPSQRVLNHFHNPLAEPWWTAGLLGIGQSSVLWQQNPAQDNAAGGGNWSWQDARRYFLDTLRGETRAQRERTLVETFEALGHLTHLIQDAAVPAHVRDDPHPSFIIFGRRIPINPDWYEDWVDDIRESDPVLFGELLNQPPVAPPVSVFTPTDDLQAPVPVARLIDTDRFRSALANIDVTAEPAIGIAESTNGNYLSRDTLFRRFPFPRQQALGALPVIEPEGAEFRRYFSKTTEGEPVRLFVTEGALHRSLTAALGAPPPAGGWFLDERVHQEYAARLLPRAVGYSATLLDYFFRGPLEASIQPVTDPETGLVIPDVLELVATNTSPDPLGPGTLTVYVDDDTGARQPVLTPDSTPPATQVILRDVPIGLTPKDAPLRAADGTPIRFKPPLASTRYTVVYQGDLGQEKRERPAGFLGGIVAKVLGGQQAEALVPQGEQRLLRSVEGVFPLPPSIDGLEGLQFGDLDNTFVGFTATAPGSGAPAQVSAFRIRRPLGSATVPREAGPSDAEIVSLDTLKAVNFPFGLALGTSVRWRQTTRFQQPLITYTRTFTWVFSHMDPNGGAVYTPVSDVFGGGEIDPAVDQTFVFSAEFPIVLDQAHLFGSTALTPRPYFWRVAEVGFDAQERLLALVEVQLYEPNDALRPVTLRARDRTCAEFEDRPLIWTIRAAFPVQPLLWALIDVERGEVLGTTGTPLFTPSSVEAESVFPLVQVRSVLIRQGGPFAGTETTCWDSGFIDEDPRFPLEETATLTLPPRGTTAFDVTGWYRDDVQRVAGEPVYTAAFPGSFTVVYALDEETGVNKALRLNETGWLAGNLAYPREGLRMRPADTPTPQILLRFGMSDGLSAGEKARLVQWSPVDPTQTRLAFPEIQEAAVWSLQGATPRAAVLRKVDFYTEEATSLVVDFQTAKGQAYAEDVTRSYVLLAPEFLYNVEDTRFHTLDTLAPTALPLPLAPAPAVPAPLAAYHLIVLP